MRIGIDLGGTNMRAGGIKAGEIVEKRTIPCPAQADADTVLQTLKELIAPLMSPQVKGIGIGVPSVVDSQQEIVYNVANIPAWKEVPLKQQLEAHFHVPVCVNNDSNCFTLGVKQFGEGMSYRNLVGITLGTGVGAGVIVNGELYNGQNTGAGEIGSLPYLGHDFEHYCSSTFFVRYHYLTGQEAYHKALEGNVQALSIWEEFGAHVGELIKAVLFTYDPEAIFLGGGIATAFPFYEQAVWKALQTFPYATTVSKLQLIPSRKEDVALLGASALIG